MMPGLSRSLDRELSLQQLGQGALGLGSIALFRGGRIC